jgi:hypothetical protein
MRDLSLLARQAASQHGLLSGIQLSDGLSSPRAAESLLKQGLVARRGRGVYSLVGAPPSWEADLMAACLSSSRLVVASHRAALRLWGLRSVDDEIEVSIRYPANLTSKNFVVHRIRDLTQHDFTYIEGVPVTTLARTLCDAGLLFPDHELERIAEHALAKEIVTVDELWRFRRRVGRRGRNGVGPLERVLESLPPGLAAADSGPEIRFAKLCRDAGLPSAVWQHPVVACGRRYEIDFAYPEQRLAIEFDEFDEHTRPTKFADDRQRQNDLQQCGWTVIRFTWQDLRDRPSETASRIRAFLLL